MHRWAWTLCAVLGCWGCGSSTDAAEIGQGQVEIFSWWTRGGERDALDALIGAYRERWPQTYVVNSALANGDLARSALRGRMAVRNPPETFQVLVGTELAGWVHFNAAANDAQSRLEALDSLYAEEGWDNVLRPELRKLVSYDGHIYAVPINLNRENNLYFNKSLFDAAGLAPPKTLQDFYSVCNAFRGKGITPLALGAKEGSDWVVRILFQAVFVATAGRTYYLDFFDGKRSPKDAEFGAALRALLDVADCAGADADVLDWDSAARQVAEGKAAMTIHGDWVFGLLTSMGKIADVDFGEQVAPGNEGIFILGSDSFAVPKGLSAARRANAFEFLKVVGSSAGQAAFNPQKGSIPARTDAAPSTYDPIVQRRMVAAAKDSLVGSFSCINSVVPVPFDGILGDMRREYASSGNKDLAVVHAQLRVDNEYAKLRP